MVLNSREQFPLLLNELGLNGMGVEVGVQKGRFSEHLLLNWSGRLLYSVDPWREFPDKKYLDIANISQDKQDEVYCGCIRRLKRFGSRSVIWRLTSRQAAGLISPGSLDFCYIDADHSYEGASEDVRLWFPLVKQGGILAGHDYIPDGTYELTSPDGPLGRVKFGVQGAVDGFARECGLRVQVSQEKPFPSWYLIKD